MGSINIISTNTIYTAPAGTTVMGVTFVPVPTAYAAALIPPPVLTAQANAPVSSTFTVTNSPDDPAWRSAIWIGHSTGRGWRSTMRPHPAIRSPSTS